MKLAFARNNNRDLPCIVYLEVGSVINEVVHIQTHKRRVDHDDIKPITSVTIVEKDKELIELMRPFIEKYTFEDGDKTFDKFEIINDDVYAYAKKNRDKHFDWAYIDIWDNYLGYSFHLDEFEELLDEYRLIADNVDAWGYQNAVEGSDEVPTEQEEYPEYMANLIANYHYTYQISGSTYDNITDYVEFCGR